MNPENYVDLNANPDEVFSLLTGIFERGYLLSSLIGGDVKVMFKDSALREITFSTGFSISSWGEDVEVKVEEIPEGSRVIFSGRTKFPFKITGDPERPIDVIIDKLKKNFEVLKLVRNAVTNGMV
ncbi:MAG: hypothetical protein M1163_05130 [Candidatus Thermoplasmatota archaeon]|nr:hypothetical protein [Candidatus Thermoplasmatota archaeon]